MHTHIKSEMQLKPPFPQETVYGSLHEEGGSSVIEGWTGTVR